MGVPGCHNRPTSRVLSSTSSRGKETDSPGFRVLRVAGDGNCLFRSLVQSYHASYVSRDGEQYAPLGPEEEQAKAMDLRGAVCAALIDQKDFIEPFVGMDIQEYVGEMQKPSTWGGEPELSMASTVLRCKIVVYEPVIEAKAISLSKISDYCPVDDTIEDVKSIHVLFAGGMHYDALITTL